MEKQNKNNEISLGILWKVLRARFLFLVIALLIGVGLAFGYSKFLATPQYSSTAQFLVLNTASSSTATNSSYLQGTEMLAANYAQYAGGNVFVEKVVQQYNAENGASLSPERVVSRVSATPVEETAIFRVKITSSDPAEAYALLQIYEATLPTELSALDDDPERPEENEIISVKLISHGKKAAAPDSPNVKLNMVLGGFLALFLLVAVVLAQLPDKRKA